MVASENTKPAGRPRSSTSRLAILRATLELVGEKSLQKLTMEDIAERAGVGKATIYKWWSGKAFVALDAFLSLMQNAVPTSNTGSAQRDFTLQLASLIDFYRSPVGSLLRQFIAECQNDEVFATAYRKQFLEPRRRSVLVIWQRGVDRGEIDPSLDCQLVLDMIYAPLVYRVLIGHVTFGPSDAERLVAAVFAGIRPRTNQSNVSRKRPRKT